MRIQVYSSSVYGSWFEAEKCGAIYERELPSVFDIQDEQVSKDICQCIAEVIGDCLEGRSLVEWRIVR